MRYGIGPAVAAFLAISLGGCGSKDVDQPPPKPPVNAADGKNGVGGQGGGPQVVVRPLPPLKVGAFAAVRRFRFLYDVTVTDLTPGAAARIWLPIAQSDPEQNITVEKIDVPGEHLRTEEKQFGNAVLFVEATADDAGQIPLLVTYQVERAESIHGAGEQASESDPRKYLDDAPLLSVERSVAPKWLFSETTPKDARPTEIARYVYDAVLERMSFEPREDAAARNILLLQALESGVGDSVDMHRLFIDSCRMLFVPARLEAGFPIGRDAQGDVAEFRCWAKFLGDGARWVGVDLVEAENEPRLAEYSFGNLSADRVQFTTGYGLKLDPPPAAGAIDVLIYPHVEVAGKPHLAMTKRLRYEPAD